MSYRYLLLLVLILGALLAYAGLAEPATPSIKLTGPKVLVLEHERNMYVRGLAFTADGSGLISAGWDDRTLWYHDLATGKKVRSFDYTVHTEMSLLAASPNGKILAAGASLLDLATGKRLVAEETDQNCLTCSADWKMIATGSQAGLIRLVNRATGTEERRWQTSQRDITALVFSGDGSVLTSVGSERIGGPRTTICVWDTATGRTRHKWVRGGSISAVALAPNGTLLAIGGELGPVELLDVMTGMEVRSCAGEGMIFSLAFSPDGRVLAKAGGFKPWEVHLLDVATGQILRRLRVYDRDNVIGCVAFSPDGKKLAMGDRGIRVLHGDVIDLAVEQALPAPAQTQDCEPLWTDLGAGHYLKGGRSLRAYQAMQALGNTPRISVPFLQERLRPVPVAPDRRIDGLVADLDAGSFHTRQQATRADRAGWRGREPAPGGPGRKALPRAADTR